MKEFMYNPEEFLAETKEAWLPFLMREAEATNPIKTKVIEILKEIQIIGFKNCKIIHDLDCQQKSRHVKHTIVSWKGEEFSITKVSGDFRNADYNINGAFEGYHEYNSISLKDKFKITEEESSIMGDLLSEFNLEWKVRHYLWKVNYNNQIINLPESLQEIIKNEESREQHLNSLYKKQDKLEMRLFVKACLLSPIYLVYSSVIVNRKKWIEKGVNAKVLNAAIHPKTVKLMESPFDKTHNKMEKIQNEINLLLQIEIQQMQK
ncbi:hypothetical protein bcgnr5369_36260 [Bacillus cereus]